MPAWLVLLSALTIAVPIAAAGQTVPETDGVERLLAQLETLLRTGNPDGFAALTDNRSSPERIQQFAADVFRPDTVRVIVNERDRSPLEGAAPRNSLPSRRGDVHRDGRARSHSHYSARCSTACRERQRRLAHHRRAGTDDRRRALSAPVERFNALRPRGLTISAIDLLITWRRGTSTSSRVMRVQRAWSSLDGA